MPWKLYGLTFKTVYGNGYRYLDRCGEFLLEASAQGFLPGEATPTGGQLALPEVNLQANINSRELTVHQEFMPALEVFADACAKLGQLAEKHFGPLDCQFTSFLGKWFFAVASEEEAKEAILKWKQNMQDELAKRLDMVSASTRLDYNFVSGKSDLHVMIQPIAFTSFVRQHVGPGFRPTRDQRQRVSRVEKGRADALPKDTFGLMLEANLTELDPPPVEWVKEKQRFAEREKVLLTFFS